MAKILPMWRKTRSNQSINMERNTYGLSLMYQIPNKPKKYFPYKESNQKNHLVFHRSKYSIDLSKRSSTKRFFRIYFK